MDGKTNKQVVMCVCGKIFCKKNVDTLEFKCDSCKEFRTIGIEDLKNSNENVIKIQNKSHRRG